MKIGDMVVRAYAFRAFIPGIIIDEVFLRVEPDAKDEDENFEPYTEHNFVIAWSDGTTSEEMDVELDYLEDMLEACQEIEE